MKKRIARLQGGIAAAITAMLLAACGGGGGSEGGGTPPPPPPPTLTGKLIDSAVGGVKFTSAPSGKTGTTSAAGEFQYVAGDTVQFAVGNVVLGSVSGQETVTPKVIADATVNLPAGVSSTEVAKNLAIFLQSFDADGNPDNGITIAADVGTAAASITLNFGQPTSEFTDDPNLKKLADDTGSTIVTPEAAAAHQARGLAEQMAGTWLLKEADGSVTTATFFTDGTYVLGEMTKDPECTHGVEWGRYELDANAGTIVARDSFVDTNGDCGLNNPDKSAQQQLPLDLELSGDGNTLTLSDDEGTYPLTRVPVGTGLAGSWLLDQPVAEGEPIVSPYVLTLLADGTFLLADIGEPELNPGSDSQPGIEYGTWTAGSDNSFTITQIITDTDGPDAGFSTGTATRKLVDDKIVITDEEVSVSLTRLPLTKTVEASELTGSWYAVEEDSGAISALTLFKDGSFSFGSQDADPDCDRDYGNANPNQSADGDLDPDGIGSEFGQWFLESGLGRVYTADISVDSDGSCGMFSKNQPRAPSYETGVFFKKIDADTLEITSYEHQDGGTDETTDDSYQPSTSQIKRVPSQAKSLIGSWKVFNADGGLDEVAYFFADGTLFEVDADEKGGVGRAKWSLSGASLTVHYDGSDPKCVDTIGPDSDCAENDGAGHSFTTTLTMSDDGKSATLSDASDDTGPAAKLTKID